MRVSEQRAFLEILGTKNKKMRKAVLENCNPEEMNALCELCLNILDGHVPLKRQQKEMLCRYKSILRVLADKKVSSSAKRSLLKKPQTGGFLPILAALIPAAISAITAAFQ